MKKKTKPIRHVSVAIAIILSCLAIQAQTKEKISIKPVPYPIQVFNEPLNIEVTEGSNLKITASGKTNLFNSPGNNYYVQNAPMLLFHPDSNFVLSAKVTAKLSEVYDVASLVIYENKDLWAKLCFENSINKEATVVSVVTRKFSDDCNSVKVTGNSIYLLITKKGNEFSFHCSTDNIKWDLIRHFNLQCDDTKLMIGFAAHCSRGDMFTAEFSDIYYSNKSVKNLRKYQ